MFELELRKVLGTFDAGTAKPKIDPKDEPQPPPYAAIGKRVEVTGLAARPELNGQVGGPPN